jgi:CubicO group peptidase (beta-lactamase class C family)
MRLPHHTGNRATAFGHGGHGGAMGFADPEYRFAFGLAKNRLRADPPGEDAATLVARTIRAALGIPEDG